MCFVRMAGETEFPDRTLTLRYRFVHILYQNTLYGSLQPTRRAALSAKVAESVVRHQGSDVGAGAAQLGMLFEGARDFRAAAAQFLAAARHAAGLFAFPEAIALARRGIAALEGLPEDPARMQVELGLQLILGLSLRSIQGWAAPEVEKPYLRARQICQQLGNTPELFPVLWGLTLFHAIRGDLRVFQTLAEQLLAQATATGKPANLVAAHQMMASVNEFLGRTVTSNEHAEKALALHSPDQHLSFISRFGLDPGMIVRALSVRPLWFLGFPDQSLTRIQATVTLARALNHPISIVFAVALAENIHLLRGEAAEAVYLGDEMIAVCREYGLAQEVEWGRCFQALALADLGRVEEGVAQLRDSLAVQEGMSAGLLRATFLAHLAEALLRADRPDEGLEAVAEGFAAAERGLERYYLAELFRLRGELLARTGDAAGAEHSFVSALEFARSQGAKSLELRAATGLARLLAPTARNPAARATLWEIYCWFTEGHAHAGPDRGARAARVAALTAPGGDGGHGVHTEPRSARRPHGEEDSTLTLDCRLGHRPQVGAARARGASRQSSASKRRCSEAVDTPLIDRRRESCSGARRRRACRREDRRQSRTRSDSVGLVIVACPPAGPR